MIFQSIGVIALSTLKGFFRDRIFHAALLVCVLFTLFAYLLSSLTIIESRKILVDFGLSAISLSGVVMAIFIGIVAIGKEIESKTIYTVLSKPISRFQYLVGKYIGCALACILAQLCISSAMILILYSLGEGYPDGLAVCLCLLILESLLVLAIATFFTISVSSNFLAGSMTIAIFLIGRSAHSFKIIGEKSNSETIKNTLRVLYDIIPNLDRFNIREVVAYSKSYPSDILLWSSLYFAAYAMALLALTALQFNKKDLA